MKRFFSDLARLKEENGVLKIVLLGVTIALIVSVIANFRLYKDKTIVVIPPKLTKEFQVSGNLLSKEYFEQVGFYLADRILSVSPENVDASYDSILTFMTTDPEAIKIIRENMALQAKTVKDNDLYQVFYPMKVIVNDEGKIFTVEGVLKRISGNNPISSENAIINFGFDVVNGKLIITSIEVK